MSNKVKISTHVIILIISFSTMVFMIRSCVDDKKHSIYSLKEIAYLKSIKIDSILIYKYDHNGIRTKVVLKDSVLKQKIVIGYLNLVKCQSGNGRYSSDGIVLEFYSNTKVLFSSIAWVNDYSTLVFIKNKANDKAPSYGNLLMNKELGKEFKNYR